MNISSELTATTLNFISRHFESFFQLFSRLEFPLMQNSSQATSKSTSRQPPIPLCRCRKLYGKDKRFGGDYYLTRNINGLVFTQHFSASFPQQQQQTFFLRHWQNRHSGFSILPHHLRRVYVNYLSCFPNLSSLPRQKFLLLIYLSSINRFCSHQKDDDGGARQKPKIFSTVIILLLTTNQNFQSSMA